MSLRFKVALIMAVAVLMMAGLNAAVLIPVSRSFAELEQAEARRNSDRIEQALAAELQHLARNALDWSHWDDAYEFLDGQRPSFVEDNLNFDTLRNLDVHLMYWYDRAGNIVWGEAYDLDSETLLDIAEFAPGALRPDSPLLVGTVRESTKTGIMITSAGPMLVASSPILPTEGPRPANGTFVLGRFIDAPLIERIRTQASVDFDVAPVRAGEPRVEGFSVEVADFDLLVGHTVMNGIDGAPALHVRSMTPRDVSRVGHRSLGISLLSLVLVGLVDLTVMWFLLRQLVLRPVSEITRHILEIGRAGALDRRVPAMAGDELGALAQEFNRMLDRLSDANKQLVDQSHRTGMAEMAAGVLHNLRNSLSPLVGRLDLLSETTRQAPGGELRRAVEEIRNPETDPARKERLFDYIAATGDSIAGLRETTLRELGRATALASKLGDILKHQDKFIYSSSSMGALSLRDVLRDAMDLLPPRLAASVAIDLGSAIDALPPVIAERIALMQVFHNLLLNAIEAIQAAGRPDGRIEVTAVSVPQAPGQVDVQIRDNGIGIEAGNLARIFERGYTTKPSRAGGLGLHWCANTVINMRGRLHVDSAGSGTGSTVHLLLPLARQEMAAE